MMARAHHYHCSANNTTFLCCLVSLSHEEGALTCLGASTTASTTTVPCVYSGGSRLACACRSQRNDEGRACTNDSRVIPLKRHMSCSVLSRKERENT
jgi:hypothetical protein